MRVLSAAVVFVLALSLAGCSGSNNGSSSSSSNGSSSTGPTEDHSTKTYQVSMAGNAFVNNSYMIKTGDIMIWTHHDGPTVAHTVTSDAAANPEKFDSSSQCVAPIPVPNVPNGCMTSGTSFQWAFTKEGTYTIHCKIHSGMTMTVMVMAHNMTMAAA